MTDTVTQRSSAPAALPVTFPRVLKSEWTKFRSLRSSWWSIAATVILIIGIGSGLAGVAAANASSMPLPVRAVFIHNKTAVSISIAGVYLAQLAIGVLGVLVFSGEYASGQIRATFTAVPGRLAVLWAKASTFAVSSFAVTAAAVVAAFVIAQAELSGSGLSVPISSPGVARVLVGGALYVTLVGLLGVGLGALLRSTAGAIAVLFAVLLIVPIIANFLPSGWGITFREYLPSNAGTDVMNLGPTAPHQLSPWAGFGVFCAYAAVVLLAAAAVLRQRDV